MSSDKIIRALAALDRVISHQAHDRIVATIDAMIRFPLGDEIPLVLGLPGVGKTLAQRSLVASLNQEYCRTTAAVMQRLHQSPKGEFDWVSFHRGTMDIVGHPHTARITAGSLERQYYSSNRWRTAADCSRDAINALQKRQTIVFFVDEFHEILQCASNDVASVQPGLPTLTPESATEVTSTLNIFKGFADDLTSPTVPGTHRVRLVLASTYSILDSEHWGDAGDPWANHLRRRLSPVHYAPYSMSDADLSGYADLLDALQAAIADIAPADLLRDNRTLIHRLSVGSGGETIGIVFRAARSLLTSPPGTKVSKERLIEAAKPESHLEDLRAELRRGLRLLAKDNARRQSGPLHSNEGGVSIPSKPRGRRFPGRRNPSRDRVL